MSIVQKRPLIICLSEKREEINVNHDEECEIPNTLANEGAEGGDWRMAEGAEGSL